jgi:hypothetical protein
LINFALAVYILDPHKAAEQEEIQQQMESYGDLLFEMLDNVESIIRRFKVCVFEFCSSFLINCVFLIFNLTKNISSSLKENLPVISILCNPGIRDRHWDKMSNIFQKNLKPDTGTTLRKVMQLGLEPYMEQFEQVSAGASKV